MILCITKAMPIHCIDDKSVIKSLTDHNTTPYHASAYTWVAKGGARGARAPSTFIRGVLSTPILDLLLRHGDHVTLF